jgi:hypothetical protein
MNPTEIAASMNKSVLAFLGLSGLLALLGLLALALGAGAIGVLVLLLAAGALLLAQAGRMAQQRQRQIDSGAPDMFLAHNTGRSEQAVLDGRVPRWSGLRRALALHLFGHRLMVADTVRVKSLAEIRATLDANSKLDGLPFMDEMAAFCGAQARVYRVIDKVYDYGRSREMRRLDDAVLLVGLRCDGSAHGGCEAACYLIWKAAWLETVEGSGALKAPAVPRREVPADPPETRYSCQYTELTTASQPITGAGLRGWFGPLVAGNVTFAAFRVAALTRIFNTIQRKRGGAAFPTKPPFGAEKLPVVEPLKAGDWVRVKLPHEIARTLDKNSKNRGLWFDDDMLKYCGKRLQVRGRITKIIDVGSLGMIPMKTPCIALEDAHYSGEFQGFGEQHDYLYWREAWLEPEKPAAAQPAA